MIKVNSKCEFEINYPEILDLIISQFKLGIDTVHGIKHWHKVYEIGNYLAKQTKADIEVVNFFAYFHDAKREDEYDDLEHGQRAAIFVEKLFNNKQIKISQSQFELLVFAYRHHNNSSIKSDNMTVQTCWDADRLDLWRVGVVPNPVMLNTEFSKTDDMINLLR